MRLKIRRHQEQQQQQQQHQNATKEEQSFRDHRYLFWRLIVVLVLGIISLIQWTPYLYEIKDRFGVKKKKSGLPQALIALQKQFIARKEEIEEEPRNKYAIYMTTHLSEQHIQYLHRCWPSAAQRLPLLQQSDFIIYTSSNSNEDDQLIYNILGRNYSSPIDNNNNNNNHRRRRVMIYRYQQGNSSLVYGNNNEYKKQDGAVTAMVDPFLPSNQNWFQGYEWIIRLNPDVLIRRDEWLLQQMQDPNIDAIATYWKLFDTILTDFYAFRPNAINGTALIEKYNEQKRQQTSGTGMVHAETQVKPGFQHIIHNGRMAWLPNATGNEVHARTAGSNCPVVHWHPLLQSCPNYFDAVVPDSGRD